MKEARVTAVARAEEPRQAPQPHDATSLSAADDRIRLSDWLPPQEGVIPRIRLGGRSINVLWAIPLIVVFLILGIAVAQQLRTMLGVQEFIARYPGETPSSEAVYSGFPLWLRLLHFFNFFLMMFIIRAGIQILADHPRLYWRRDCTPGTEWFRFQHDVPKDRVWTSKDDSVTIPKWLGIPGIRHSIGLARWWHFSFDLLWVINGAIFYVLLFTTDQWQRLVPTTWAVFPNALSKSLQYFSLQFPVDHSWTNYNSLQQLTYFITVFVAAPLAVVTGLMQGPAIANHTGLVCENSQSTSVPHHPLWRAVLVSVFHLRPCDAGVHYRGATELELHVRRREQQFLGRISDLGLRYGPGDRDVVACFAFYDQACPAGSEDRPNRGRPPYGYWRNGGTRRPSTREKRSHRTSGSMAHCQTPKNLIHS